MSRARGQWFAIAVAAVATATALAACGGGGSGQAGETWRVVAASGLAFERAPRPADRELHVRFTVNALTASPEPVDHVEVSHEAGRVGIRIWLRERVPASDEHVPNYAGTHSATVTLDEPVGETPVVDLSTQPPSPIPTVRTK
jgi:hypothetical protein